MPLVSIVIPLFDDEGTLVASLESALSQTLHDIEVVCVDDASNDASVAVVERYAARDTRVRLVRHDRNRSAFEARRSGVTAARGDFLLFLDGDDTLVPQTAAIALEAAQRTGADLVGFGVTVVENDGRTGGGYERRLQPCHQRLDGPGVLAGLFPIGRPAQGQLWRHLFSTALLRAAYEHQPQQLVLPRVNDLPLMFLAAAMAKKYVSISDKLYIYHFGRGGSGHTVDSIKRAELYVSAIRSIESIRSAVDEVASLLPHCDEVHAAYDSVRLSIIGYVSAQLLNNSTRDVVHDALAHLQSIVAPEEIIRAVSRFYPEELVKLKAHVAHLPITADPVRTVMLTTSTLRMGGVTAVMTSQAHFLVQAGYRVVVVARSKGSDKQAIPPGVDFVELNTRGLVDNLTEWSAICRQFSVDIVVDHEVLYARYWPEFALAARAEGAATVGWLHNFVGRPIYDGSSQLALIERFANTLTHLVSLSPLDVAYLKLRGLHHASYIPNPPSPLLRVSAEEIVHKEPPVDRVRLVWWGRLEQHTKQVTDLIEVGVQLRKLGVEYQMTVIGPDWDDMTARRFNAKARRRRVGDRVRAVGPLTGVALTRVIDDSDAFVSTSIIEGYQLTLAEAQARALPVFMYELPWLTLVQNNQGIVVTEQGDTRAMADQIANVLANPDRYRQLSAASVDAARRALSHDFASLYEAVVTGKLPAEYSPEPTMTDARELLGLVAFYGTRGKLARRADGLPGSHDETFSRRERLWQAVAPVGRKALRRVPSLRPLAHGLKGWLHAR